MMPLHGRWSLLGTISVKEKKKNIANLNIMTMKPTPNTLKPSSTGPPAPTFARSASGAFTITESDLKQYATSLGALELPHTPFPDTIPNVMVSRLSSTSRTQYVYAGIHTTFYHLPPGASSEPADRPTSTPASAATVVRGPTTTLPPREKLNSIFRIGIQPTTDTSRELLYGPGIYLTQRPAIGNLAAAGYLLGLNPSDIQPHTGPDGRPSWNWAIIQMHFFVPLETYNTLHVVPAKLIPDCQSFYHDERIKSLRPRPAPKTTCTIDEWRSLYGLSPTDVVLAGRKGNPIEELVFSQSALQHAKILAEVVPAHQEFVSYMDFRKEWRYKTMEAWGLEWSEVAVRVLEEGDNGGGEEAEARKLVKRIPETRVYSGLKGYLVDFEGLGKAKVVESEQHAGYEYWKGLGAFRTRYQRVAEEGGVPACCTKEGSTP
ncbi:hypothetical protein BDZ91DRAFT_733536 [Kalaharituber pfeilii]|nr:hypothetical protein BDZ91DRAFT_733536 [Kalaharituber pfeilii]